MLGLAEDIVLCPFQGFLVACRTHKDVAAEPILFLVTALLETLIVEVPFIVTYLYTQVLRDGIKALVDKHRTDNRSHGVEDTVGRKAKEQAAPDSAMEHHAASREREPHTNRIELHRLEIEFQRLLRTCPDSSFSVETTLLSNHCKLAGEKNAFLLHISKSLLTFATDN